MAINRVMVFLMSREDRTRAEPLLRETTWTDAFAIGSASDLDVRRLRERNLVVRELDRDGVRAVPFDADTPGAVSRALRSSRLGARVPARPRAAAAPIGAAGLTRGSTVLVETNRPLLDGDRIALTEQGGPLLENYANGFYSLRLQRDSIAGLAALPFVGRVRAYSADDSVDLEQDGLRPAAPTPPDQAQPALDIVYDVRLHAQDDLARFLPWLAERGIRLLGASGRKARISLPATSPALAQIAALDDVQGVEPYVEPVLWNNLATAVLRVHEPAVGVTPFDGDGEIVAIADTGIDSQHLDLSDRIHALVALGRPNDTSDPHGHGTHVAGSVAGTGKASNGDVCGVAPKAKLYFQSLLDSRGKLGGLPINLADLLSTAYTAGARIHSNSWGTAQRSTYTTSADEIDTFVAANADMLVVAAAGNDGNGSQNTNAAQGQVDWLSIGSPATAKNVLTVGASRSSRQDGPSRKRTWGQLNPANFPHAPISAELVTGDPECMAAFSGRGPSIDRRIKPDLVAPGTDILSTLSQSAPAASFLGADPKGRAYAFLQGSSMATPLVAGCAALTRQYYRTVRGHQPSAALLRATLINGTRWLSGADANASNPPGTQAPAANFDQGFGLLDMAMTLPGSVEDLSLWFLDDVAGSLAATGKRRRFTLTVSKSGWLRLCLVYTDPPGKGLQNNLNLFLQDPFGSPVLLGNGQLRNALTQPDVDNNVQVIRLKAAAEGDYVIQVTATNLLRPPQGFALVVTTNGQMALNEA